MEDYKQKYEQALENIKKIKVANKSNKELVDFIEYKYPELKECEDKKIKEDIISLVNEFWERIGSINPEYSSCSKMLAWLEKQGEKVIDCPQNHQDIKHPNGCIILEDFNGGEGFYKLNLDYLNKKQVAEIEELVRTWNTELNSLNNENIRACIGMCLTDADEQRVKNHNTNLKECITWLEKQGEIKRSDYHYVTGWRENRHGNTKINK